MFTADQLVAHMIGDYFLQPHSWAIEKTRNSLIAALHAITYTATFVFITESSLALLVILITHFIIDRFRLARYVTWFKNGMNFPLTATGFPERTPPYLATWLLIIMDNLMHIICNGLAIYYLG